MSLKAISTSWRVWSLAQLSLAFKCPSNLASYLPREQLLLERILLGSQYRRENARVVISDVILISVFYKFWNPACCPNYALSVLRAEECTLFYASFLLALALSYISTLSQVFFLFLIRWSIFELVKISKPDETGDLIGGNLRQLLAVFVVNADYPSAATFSEERESKLTQEVSYLPAVNLALNTLASSITSETEERNIRKEKRKMTQVRQLCVRSRKALKGTNVQRTDEKWRRSKKDKPTIKSRGITDGARWCAPGLCHQC